MKPKTYLLRAEKLDGWGYEENIPAAEYQQLLQAIDDYTTHKDCIKIILTVVEWHVHR